MELGSKTDACTDIRAQHTTGLVVRLLREEMGADVEQTFRKMQGGYVLEGYDILVPEAACPVWVAAHKCTPP